MPSNLFTPDVLAIMRQMQRDGMPATVHVLTPTLVKEPGGVARQTWSKSHEFPGRISRQTASERASGDAGARFTEHAWLLVYPHDAPALTGDECVIVEGGGTFGTPRFVHLLRVSAPSGPQTFPTRRTASVTDLGVPGDVDVAAFITNPDT